MAKKSDACDRIVRATASLLASHGYYGTGLNDVIRLSEAPKGSLYHYFPQGKPQMAAAAVTFIGEEVASALAQAGKRPPHGRQLLQAMTATLRSWLTRSQFQASCPVFSTAMSSGEELAVVREACAQAFANWMTAIEQALLRDGLGAEQAASRACLAIAALEGAVVLARTRESLEPLEQIERELLGLLPDMPAARA